jgi:protein-tyrosine phosphatase
MIDLHFHCLPGIDDGPRSWDEAVALCRAAEAEGTTTIVATPHVLHESWANEDPAERDRLILRLNALLGGSPAIVPGCELAFSSDIAELWERGSRGPLVGLNRRPVLLIELPNYGVPAPVEAVFHELTVMNITPVLAHPERNAELVRNPDRLAALVARGALAQVTAAAVLGEMGHRVQTTVQNFFRLGLVHLIASDAHSIERRPPRLAAARHWVSRNWGPTAEVELFETNPALVLQLDALVAGR